MKLDQLPQSSPWVVFVIAQVSAVFELLNPILQGLAFVVAIALGALQFYCLHKKGKK